ncbi:MAG TPA: hypothetical protein VIJ85_02535 [Rhizomicrobium sp.]
MDNGLAEGAIRQPVVQRDFVVSRRLHRGDFQDAGGTWVIAVDVRLRDEGLKRESEDGHEHDKPARQTRAPLFQKSRCGSRHEACKCQISLVYDLPGESAQSAAFLMHFAAVTWRVMRRRY